MNTISLKGIEITKIRRTALVKAYNSETEGFKGKKYHIFSFKDQAFVVHQDDAFLADFAAGKVWGVELGQSDEGLSLLNYSTIDQTINVAKVEGLLKYYSSENFKPAATAVENPADLIALG